MALVDLHIVYIHCS